MPLLFSCGTLQQEGVQLATFGRRLSGKPDAILGFQETTMEMTDEAVIALSGKRHHPIAAFSGDTRHRINGVAYEVSDEELLRADGYETNPAYKRYEARLASGRKGWVYGDARFAPDPNFDPEVVRRRATGWDLVARAFLAATIATAALIAITLLLMRVPFLSAIGIIAGTIVLSLLLSWGLPVGEFVNGFVVPNGLGLLVLVGAVWLLALAIALVVMERSRSMS